ncbi:MAG: AAA family ATPase [Anaerolineae bacterium]|nr:AAA family ATPase [Anaerolineae bacterium]
MPTIHCYFLGTSQFTKDDQPLKLTKTKGIALLVYLAVERTTQTREQVMTLLWPDSLPQAARKNLRNTLWDIGKTFDEEVVEVDGDTLRLAESVWVDLRPFEDTPLTADSANIERLEEAVALYRAPLADGLSVLDAPDFELWLTTQQQRVGRHYLRLLDILIAAHRKTANWQGVITFAEQALAYDNLQEPMHQALMEAQAHLGERAKAVRQYDMLRAILEQELGVPPLPETESLRSAILNGHIQANPQSIATNSQRPTRKVAPTGSPFVGREAEQAALDEALQMATAGQARIVLLTGELGIGKSRLWQQWSATLPDSLTTLETRCLDNTQSLPFAPLTRLFSHSVCIQHFSQPNAPISPIWLAELTRLLPEIKELRPDLPEPSDLPPTEERGRLLEAFIQILRSLNGQTTILFIDDLHWADQATLDWLVYLLDRLRNESLLVVATYRVADAPAQLVHTVANWKREGQVHHLPLERLTLTEATQLINALGGNPALVEQLYTKSAGNPYFLIELNRAGPEDTPSALADLIRARFDRLSGATQQVLQAAAILEAEFDFETLRRTSGRGEEETLNALDDLLEAIVLTEVRGVYEFSHPLVAVVMREGLSAARRQFLHRRAGEALEAAHSTNVPAVAGQIAAHYAAANMPAPAARYAKMAGDHAMSLVAFTEAAMFYRQAYSLDPAPTRQMDLAEALSLTPGALDEARDTLQQALNVFEAENDKPNIVKACLMQAFSYLPSGEGDKIIAWVERALPHLESIADPAAEARAHFFLGAGGFRIGRSMSEAEAQFAEALRLAVEHDLSETAMNSWFELGNLNLQRGDFAKAREAFQQSLVLAQTKQNIYQEAICHNNLAYATLLAGDIEQARAHIEKGLDFAETHSLMLPRQYLYSTRGEIALAEEKLDEAEQWFLQAITEAEKFDNMVHAANVRANLALVARARGELDEALTLLDDVHHVVAGVTNPHLQTQVDLWLAELYAQRGEPDAAVQALTRAEEHLTSSPRRGLQAWAKRVRRLVQQTTTP